MSNRHYHIWLYERDAEGRINTMRCDGATFHNRRQANYALETFRFLPGMKGPIKRPGQVVACDDGAFCEPHTDRISGFSVGGPLVLPVTQFIDRHDNSNPLRRRNAHAI